MHNTGITGRSGPRRFLILYADFGAGHRMAAKGLQAAFERRWPSSTVVQVTNPLNDRSAPRFLRIAGRWYDRGVTLSPMVYRWAYALASWKPCSELIEGVLMPLIAQSLRRALLRFDPDAVIATHPLFLTPLTGVFALGRRPLPTYVVVTDMTKVAPMWFNPGADRTFVPTTLVAQEAVRAGLQPERVQVTGIPVHPDFALGTPSKAELRARLGWDPRRVTALVVGSPRSRNIAETIHCLNQSDLPLQLVSVAGGDRRVYEKLETMQWRMPHVVYDRVDNMPELLRASDLVISKAGGLIASEALAAGIPMLLVDVIQGQEAGNAEYILAHQAGELAHRPSQSVDILRHWLNAEAAELRHRSFHAGTLGQPRAAYAIADSIREDPCMDAHGLHAYKNIVKLLARMPQREQLVWSLPQTAIRQS